MLEMDDSGAKPWETESGAARAQRCPACGENFVCGMRAGSDSCWCAQSVLRLPVPGKEAACYCPRCLEKFRFAGPHALRP